jgi:Protein of unknown function (DUF2752)
MYYQLSIINWLKQHQLPCIFKKITHFDCPGCGFQRSFIELLRGNVEESFKVYPALIPILMLFIILVLHLSKKMPNGTKVLKFSYIFCISVILVSYIYKIINHQTN